MILIVVKWHVKPEFRDTFLDQVAGFTAATRAEPGNLWFDWSRSVDNPDEFILVEAFEEGDAPAEHVNSAHFKKAQLEIPPLLSRTPDIINVQVDGNEWSALGEMAVKD